MTMTRRRFAHCTFAGVPWLVSCNALVAKINPELLQWEKQLNLAVLNVCCSNLIAVGIDGATLGRLDLPGYVSDLAISPTADSIAWAHIDQPIVSRFDGIGPVRTIPLNVDTCVVIAISSIANMMAVVVWKNKNSRLLIMEKEDMIDDVTGLLNRFGADKIERLHYDSSGDCLAIGSRQSLLVIDRKSRTRVFESTGRFPKISPDGKQLAFVDERNRLNLRDIKEGKNRFLNLEAQVWGVGAWSPDGQYLLVGTKADMALQRRVRLIDVKQAESIEIGYPLAEGDYGDRCAWINRRFVSVMDIK